MRTFIAVELPAPPREALAAVARSLSRHFPSGAVRWTKADNLHLTLRFLGDTEAGALPALQEVLDDEAARVPAFHLVLGRLGAFPHPEGPRVLWVGLGGALSALRRLQRQLELRVRDLGWEAESKPFTPHLTIGRVRPSSRPNGDGWAETPVPALELAVDELVLMRSELGSGGARYTALHRSPLSP